MPHRLSALALVAVLVASCSLAGEAIAPTTPAVTSRSTPSGSQGPLAPAGASQSPAGTRTLGPRVTLALDTRGPIVHSGDGPAGHGYGLPAAAARDAAGGYVLFIVWFGPEAGDQVVTLARSDDARSWRVSREAILTDLGMDLANPGPIPSAILQADDGTWRLFGWAAHRADPSRFSSWQASGPRPEGPWTLVDEEIVATGPSGAWDEAAASVASVQRTPAGFSLWYEGQPTGSTRRGDVGLATSADGLDWAKWDEPATSEAPFAESDPIITRGFCGAGTAESVSEVQVEPGGPGYVAVLGATEPGGPRNELFGATSEDGRTWRCGSETPILRDSAIPGSEGIHTMTSLRLADGAIALILESLLPSRSELWLATLEVAR